MTDKIIDRYNKQTGRHISHLQSAVEPVDNLINAHQKAREQFYKYQEQKQQQELEKQLEKEIQKKAEKQVGDVIEKTLKDIWKQF